MYFTFTSLCLLFGLLSFHANNQTQPGENRSIIHAPLSYQPLFKNIINDGVVWKSLPSSSVDFDNIKLVKFIAA